MENLGSYKSDFINFVEGKEYSISAKVGEETLTATDIIPKRNVFIENFSSPTLGDSNAPKLEFSLKLRQAQTEKQYFHILLQQRWVNYTVNQNDTNFVYKSWF